MNNITSIPAGNYEGYIWESDKDKPTVCKGEYCSERDLTAISNPFIIEAQLFDRNTGDSYSVRFIDNTYYAKHLNINAIEGFRQNQTFLANFDNAPGKLEFITIWREEKDPLCNGMDVLSPRELVFVGFEK